MKKYLSEAKMDQRESHTQRSVAMIENRNYISQNENQFFTSGKIFYKPNSHLNKY